MRERERERDSLYSHYWWTDGVTDLAGRDGGGGKVERESEDEEGEEEEGDAGGEGGGGGRGWEGG